MGRFETGTIVEVANAAAALAAVRAMAARGFAPARLGFVAQPQRRQRDAGEAEAELLQRPAPRDGLGKAFGQFIEFVVHNFPFGLLVVFLFSLQNGSLLCRRDSPIKPAIETRGGSICELVCPCGADEIGQGNPIHQIRGALDGVAPTGFTEQDETKLSAGLNGRETQPDGRNGREKIPRRYDLSSIIDTAHVGQCVWEVRAKQRGQVSRAMNVVPQKRTTAVVHADDLAAVVDLDFRVVGREQSEIGSGRHRTGRIYGEEESAGLEW